MIETPFESITNQLQYGNQLLPSPFDELGLGLLGYAQCA